MATALRWVAFFSVFGLLVVGAHVYLYRRLFRDTSADPRWRRAGRALLWVLGLSVLSAWLLTRVIPLEVARRAGGVTFLWLGLAIYLVLALATVDGLRALLGLLRPKPPSTPDGAAPEQAPLSPERRVFLSRAMGAAALTVAGGSASFGVFRAYYPPAVSDVPVKLPGLPRELDGFTLVQLSDVHAGHSVHEKWMGELVDRCIALSPDLLAITGDLVDGRVSELGQLISHLQRIHAREGTWFVTGNHDYYAGAQAWCDALAKMGIQSLRNRRVEVGRGKASFDLIGVDDQGQPARRDGTGYDLNRAVEGRDPSRPAVLLAHRPNDFDRAASLGIGLQLSGHTHGGQTFPFTAIARLIWPRCAGLYGVGDAHLYVSRGVGFVGPPLRAGSPPEIVRITLLS